MNRYPYSDMHEMNLDWILLKVKEMIEEWDTTKNAWTELKEFVETYFENLDVQQEINNKLDEMAQGGELAELMQPYLETQLPIEVATQIADVVALQINSVVAAQLPGVVTDQLPAIAADAAAAEVGDWLADHVDPDTGYVIDDTLRTPMAAADAKVTGDLIRNTFNSLKSETRSGKPWAGIYEGGMITEVSPTSDATYTMSNGNMLNLSTWSGASGVNCVASIYQGTVTIAASGDNAYMDTLNYARAFSVLPDEDYMIQVSQELQSGSGTYTQCYIREYAADQTIVNTVHFSMEDGVNYGKYLIHTDDSTEKVAIRLSVGRTANTYTFTPSMTRGDSEIPIVPYDTPSTYDADELVTASLISPYALIENDQGDDTSLTVMMKTQPFAEYATPEMFGAYGDGTHDDTLAVKKALELKNVKLFKSYKVTDDLIVSDEINIDGGGSLILDGSSVTFKDLERKCFNVSNLTIIVTTSSTKSAIKIINCKNGSLDGLLIKNSVEFQDETWKGIEVYASESAGSSHFIKVNNLQISGAGTGIYLYSDDVSNVTSLHFSNVVIERFSRIGVHVVGKKSYAITFDGITIDDNYASGHDRTGIKLDYVSGVFFNNMVIWADARNYGNQFNAIYITDLSALISPDVFNGYVEGWIDDHTEGKLQHCHYAFFYQKVDSLTGEYENIGYITR